MINVRIPHKEVKKLSPKITVLGVGGAGGNAVNNMIASGLQGCEFIVCNTDAQALDGSLSDSRVQLGVTVTGGLGAGAKPEIGRAAAEESVDEVASYLDGANMAFITAGMGGGTGTGAAPVIARLCRDLGILTVGVVTKPFHFEGTHRMKMAEAGIQEMQQYVDTLIVIPNQNLFRVANEKTTFAEAFKMADSVLQSGVRGVTDLMVMPGLINLDFADVRSAMLEMGKAMMGTGESSGERRAVEAAEAAINNPLLDDVSMKGARGVIINVTGGFDMTLFEVDEACNRIRDEVDPNANIIFGSTFDDKLDGIMRVSVVATGIDAEVQQKPVRHYGGGLANAVSGQGERKLERAQPNVAETAEVARGVDVPVSVSPVAANIPLGGPVTASAMSYAAAMAAAKKPEESEVDIFGQQAPSDVAATRSEAAPRQSAQAQEWPVQQTQGAMRGSVYGDSFIPPAPVEPEVPYGAAVSAGGLSARRPVDVEPPVQTVTAPGLSLRPPTPGAGAHRKKTPSLFERFTGPLWQHGQRDGGGHQAGGDISTPFHARSVPSVSPGVSERAPATGSTPSAAAPALRAPQREAQGSLNIDRARPDASEDDLDIPAFLRRQAN